MYQPASNACNGPNGTQPVPASVMARARRQLATVNASENAARNAVLGYCTDPASYPAMPNIQNEIASAPTIPQIVANLIGTNVGQVANGTMSTGTSSGVSPTASGVPVGGSNPAVPVCWSDAPISTVPLQGTTPAMPPVPSLLLPDASNAGLGDYPPWGDAFSGASGNPAAVLSSVTNWFAQNPGLTFAGALLLIAALFGKK